MYLGQGQGVPILEWGKYWTGDAADGTPIAGFFCFDYSLIFFTFALSEINVNRPGCY